MIGYYRSREHSHIAARRGASCVSASRRQSQLIGKVTRKLLGIVPPPDHQPGEILQVHHGGAECKNPRLRRKFPWIQDDLVADSA